MNNAEKAAVLIPRTKCKSPLRDEKYSHLRRATRSKGQVRHSEVKFDAVPYVPTNNT